MAHPSDLLYTNSSNYFSPVYQRRGSAYYNHASSSHFGSSVAPIVTSYNAPTSRTSDYSSNNYSSHTTPRHSSTIHLPAKDKSHSHTMHHSSHNQYRPHNSTYSHETVTRYRDKSTHSPRLQDHSYSPILFREPERSHRWSPPPSPIESYMTDEEYYSMYGINRVPSKTPISVPKKSFDTFDANQLKRFEPTYESVIPGLTGLRNLGNTCYMNSVLQALNNTKLLMFHFINNDYVRFLNRENPLGYKGKVAEEFALLVRALWSGKYRDISPREFRYMVATNAEMFSGHQQQDSQEFLLFLLDGLHEDLNEVKHRPNTPFKDDESLPDGKRAELSWNWHTRINKSIIVELFQGQFKSTVHCLSCQRQSVTFDAFMYLSLPLANSNKCSLKDCMELFLREERMSGSSKWMCPGCNQMRDAVKKIDIWKLPPYLLIHLKRFSCDGAYRQKLNTYVDFPMKSMDLNYHVRGPQSSARDTYNLYAVSNHYGSMEGGHYTAYAKNKESSRWHKFDDDIINPLKPEEVKTTAAYILFYESNKYS